MSGLAHGTVRTRQHRHTWRIISKTPDHFESIRAWKEANPSDSPEEEEEQKAEPSGRKQGQRARGARQQGKAAKKHRSAALSAADGSRAKSASPPPAEERPTGPAGPPPALLQQVYAALREQHDAGLHPDWALGPAPRSGSTSTAQSFHVARITTGMAVRVDVEQSNLDGGECCGYVVALFRAGVFNTVDTSSWGDMPARLASYHDLEAVLHRIAAARCCPGVEDDGGVRACSALRNHAWPGAAVQTDTVLGPAGLLSWCVRHDSCPLLLAPGAACCVDCRRLKHYCLQVRQQAAAAATHGL